MDNLYQLNSDKTKYKNLKINLKSISFALSSSSLNSDLDQAAINLKNNYSVDSNFKYYDKIKNIVSGINNDCSSLANIINDINSKINSINKGIEELNNGNN